MTHNDGGVPPELQQLGLSHEQLVGVRRFIGLRVDVARSQRRIAVALCVILAAALLGGQVAGGANELPFETLAQVVFRYATWAASAVAVASMGMLQLSAWRLGVRLGEFGRDYGMTDAQCDRVREIGHAVSMSVLLGPVGLLLGRKNNNL